MQYIVVSILTNVGLTFLTMSGRCVNDSIGANDRIQFWLTLILFFPSSILLSQNQNVVQHYINKPLYVFIHYLMFFCVI